MAKYAAINRRGGELDDVRNPSKKRKEEETERCSIEKRV